MLSSDHSETIVFFSNIILYNTIYSNKQTPTSTTTFVETIFVRRIFEIFLVPGTNLQYTKYFPWVTFSHILSTFNNKMV